MVADFAVKEFFIFAVQGSLLAVCLAVLKTGSRVITGLLHRFGFIVDGCYY